MKRPRSHVVGDQSRAICRSLLPSEWICRDILSDYGVDMEVEIVDDDLVTGKRLWLQIKGTQSIDTRSKYVAFRADTKLLDYSLRCDFPLLLALADVMKKEAYWLPLRNEVECCVEMKTPGWREQKYATVRVPLTNSFSKEKDREFYGLRWFSMEPARMRAFSIIHYYYDELMCTYPWTENGLETDLSKDEIEMLEKGLKKTRLYLTLALEFDSVFGSQGCDLLILMTKRQIEEGIQGCNTLQQRIQRGEKPFVLPLGSEENLSYFRIHSALESLTRGISLYFEAREKFLYHEEEY